MRLTFNRLVHRDLRGALSHYDDAAGPQLARRFYDEFEDLLAAIQRNPKRFHGLPGSAYRRANFPSFPYHVLFRETADGARVLVLRHHRQHPDYGLGRR
jgi:plasmid stabilization system protein ParE